MAESAAQPEQAVNNDVGNSRYTLTLRDVSERAFLTYVVRDSGSVYDLTHTYVTPAMRGHGVAARLVQHAVQHARHNGHKIIASCSYILAYMERNPQDKDVLLAAAGGC